MASVGHLHKLVARKYKLLRHAWKQLQSRFPQAQAELQPIYARNGASKHPINRLAQIKQNVGKGRWYTTHAQISSTIRRFTTAAGQKAGVKYDKASFPSSRVASAINAFPGRAPFASTLRPNLTGGTLGRTAGGYSLGGGRIGGARYFSHGPAAPAEVVRNVGQAVRAFCLGGHKAQFDGHDQRGQKKFKAVTPLQQQTHQKLSAVPKATPGSFVDFNINPTITAITPLTGIVGFPSTTTSSSFSFSPATKDLNSEGLLDILSADFSRQLRDLAAVLNDLKRLSSLGDLPITYQHRALRVHFPGVDADSVSALLDEIGVQSGVVGQDDDFDAFNGTEIALLFPFAPSNDASECSLYKESLYKQPSLGREKLEWRDMISPEEMSSHLSVTSEHSFEDLRDPLYLENNPWQEQGRDVHDDEDSPSGCGSLRHLSRASESTSPLEYQGMEGILRFIEQCDNATKLRR